MSLKMDLDIYPNTNSIVTGDIIIFKEGVFSGSYPKSTFEGYRFNKCKILKESYGSKRGQHTFTLEIIKSEGEDALCEKDKIRRKGRNIYKDCVKVSESKDFEILQKEKNNRAYAAKMNKYRRWFFEERFDKIPDDILSELQNAE
jgi:hypothetical protein